MTSRPVLIDHHPGRSTQSIGIARAIGADPDLIHEPSVGVVGTKGDSQCYLGVMSKVEAIHEELKGRVGAGQGTVQLAGGQQGFQSGECGGRHFRQTFAPWPAV